MPFEKMKYSAQWHMFRLYNSKGIKILYPIKWYVNFISDHLSNILLFIIIFTLCKELYKYGIIYYASLALLVHSILELPIFILWYNQPPTFLKIGMIVLSLWFTIYNYIINADRS